MEKREKINQSVKEYFDKNAKRYIPNFDELLTDEKNDIVSIGTSIICTRLGVGYGGGSFVQSVIDNDLSGAFANADHNNANAIRFYLVMMYNMPVVI